MPTTPLLGITEVSPNQSQKEVTINDAILALEGAQNATLAVAYGVETSITLSVENFTRHFIFVAGTTSADAILQIPHLVNGDPTSRTFAVRNKTGHGLTVRTDSGLGGDTVVIPNGDCRFLYVGEDDVIVAAQPTTLVEFVDLSDVPNSYSGQAGKALVVKGDESGLEYLTLISNILDAGDVDNSPAITNGQVLKWNSTSGKFEPATLALGATTFLGLTDTPSSYSGAANKIVRVNGASNALEFADPESPTLVSYVSAQYWRIRALTSLEDKVAIGTLKFLDVDGVDLATGGTASASSVFGSNTAAKAFDGDDTTGWMSNTADVAGAWVRYAFAAPVEVHKVGLIPMTSFGTYGPSSFVIERSDDGTTWVSEGTRSAAVYADGVEQDFPVNGVPVQGVPPDGEEGQLLSADDEGLPVWIDPPVALPAGGTTGQALKKASNADGDATWQTTHELPAGGTDGQVLTKTSGTDYAAGWEDLPDGLPAGGTAGQILVKQSGTDGDADWEDPEASLTVKEDGTEVASPVATINFTGDGVSVTDDGAGQVTVTIAGSDFNGVINAVAYEQLDNSDRTLGWTPAVGNLLIAYYGSNESHSPNTGWTEIANGSNFWFNDFSLLARIVEEGDTSAVQPATGGGASALVIFEVDASYIPEDGIAGLSGTVGSADTDLPTITPAQRSLVLVATVHRNGSAPTYTGLTGAETVTQINSGEGANRYGGGFWFENAATGVGIDGTVVGPGDNGNYGYMVIPLPVAAQTFLDLEDTPSSYSGQTGKLVAVNATEDALEFIPADFGASYPAGGATGQALVKASGADDDVTWATVGTNLPDVTKRALVYLAADWDGTDSSGNEIPFDTALYDVGGWWDIGAPTRLTVPAGVTQVRVIGNIETDGQSGEVFATIYKNGNNAYPGAAVLNREGGGSVDSINLATAAIPVEEGDYFEINVYGAGGNNFQLNHTWLAIEDVTLGIVLPNPIAYRFGSFFNSSPAANEVLMVHPLTEDITLPANFAGTFVYCDTAPTGSTEFTVNKIDSTGSVTEIGTLTVATDGSVTLATTGGVAIDLVAGDRVQVVGPSDSNDIEDMAWTFVAEIDEGAFGGGGGGPLVPTVVQMKTIRGDATLTLDSATTAGNLLVFVFAGYQGGEYAPSGFNYYDRLSYGNQRVAIFWRWADGTETAWSLSASDNQQGILYEFADAAGLIMHPTGSVNQWAPFGFVSGTTFDLGIMGAPYPNAVGLAAFTHDYVYPYVFDDKTGLHEDYVHADDGVNHWGGFLRLDPNFTENISGSITTSASEPTGKVWYVMGKTA